MIDLVHWRGDGPRPRVIALVPTAPPLAPLLAAEGAVPPDVDRVLTTLAFAASDGDVAARNALYAACEPKIATFVRRFTRGFGRDPWQIDPDDAAQEAFIAFAELVDGWSGGDSFSAFFHGCFPLALRQRMRRLRALEHRAGPLLRAPLPLVVDESAAAEDALLLLESIAAELPGSDGEILLRRVRDGASIGAIAAAIGVERKTVSRTWGRIAADLKRRLEAADGEV